MLSWCIREEGEGRGWLNAGSSAPLIFILLVQTSLTITMAAADKKEKEAKEIYRLTMACDACRVRKRKCDGGSPCSYISKRISRYLVHSTVCKVRPTYIVEIRIPFFDQQFMLVSKSLHQVK